LGRRVGRGWAIQTKHCYKVRDIVILIVSRQDQLPLCAVLPRKLADDVA
jgi:hypothetical protein